MKNDDWTRQMQRDVDRLARDLDEILERLLSRIEKIIRRLERIAFELQQKQGAAIAPRTPPDRPPLLIRDVHHLLIERNEIDGSAQVRANELPSFRLTPALGDLFEIISAPTGTETDGDLVGWKDVEQVRLSLSERVGRTVNRQAFNNSLFRLKGRLRDSGIASCLVQRNPRKRTVRFAARCRSEQADSRTHASSPP